MRVPCGKGGCFGSGWTQRSSGRGHQRDDGPQNWPDQNPLGKHIHGTAPSCPAFRTVVGVVGDVQPVPLDHDPAPTAYVPFAQQPESASLARIETGHDPESM